MPNSPSPFFLLTTEHLIFSGIYSSNLQDCPLTVNSQVHKTRTKRKGRDRKTQFTQVKQHLTLIIKTDTVHFTHFCHYSVLRLQAGLNSSK